MRTTNQVTAHDLPADEGRFSRIGLYCEAALFTIKWLSDQVLPAPRSLPSNSLQTDIPKSHADIRLDISPALHNNSAGAWLE